MRDVSEQFSLGEVEGHPPLKNLLKMGSGAQVLCSTESQKGRYPDVEITAQVRGIDPARGVERKNLAFGCNAGAKTLCHTLMGLLDR